MTALVTALTLSPELGIGATQNEAGAGNDFGAFRFAPPTTTVQTNTVPSSATPTTAVPADRIAGPAIPVPDPRSGDLRVDPEGDVLPISYRAPAAVEIIRDIPYGDDAAQLMDLHLPDNADAPVIAYFHSGGWIGGDRAPVPDLVMRFVERGYAVAAIGYRLAPEHPFPAPIHDAKQAVRELKVISAETALIDGDRIIAYGTSAGGHLAAFLGATAGIFKPPRLSADQAPHDSSVAGIVVAVGPTDLVELYGHPNAWARPMTGLHAGCEPCATEQLELPSPINYVNAEMPPAYWAYGALDPLVDAELQGRQMADAWGEAAGSGASWFDLVEDGDHNLDETLVNQRLVERFVDMAANGEL